MAGELKPAQLALVQNHLLVGGATGVGADVAVTGDIEFVAGAGTIPINRVSFAKMEAACRTWFNALRTWMADGMIQHGTVAEAGAADGKFKTTTTIIYTIAGAWYTAPAEDNLVFSAADTIGTAAKWGAWVLEIGVDLAKHTRSVGANQAYDDEAAALAAIIAPQAAHIQYGVITVQAAAAAVFTANTTHLHVAGGDVSAVNFYNLPAVKTLPAAL